MCNLARQWFSALVLGLALSACTPTYDWREMPAADGVLRIAFPGRPHTETRPLPAPEGPIDFHLTTTRAGGAVFAVGHGKIAQSIGPASRSALRAAMEQSLSANVRAAKIERRAVTLRPMAGSHRPAQTVDEIEIHGLAGEQTVWLLARVFVIDERLIQVAVMGTPDALSRDTAQAFLESMRLL